MGAADPEEGIPDACRLIGGHKEFEPQLACDTSARNHDARALNVTMGKRPAFQFGKVRVFDQALKQHAGLRPLDRRESYRGGDVCDIGAAPRGMLHRPGADLQPISRSGDDQKMLRSKAEHRQIIHDATIRRADTGIARLARGHARGIVDDQVINQSLGIRAFDIDSSPSWKDLATRHSRGCSDVRSPRRHSCERSKIHRRPAPSELPC